MKHYIRLDGTKVVKGFSDAFEQPKTGDICINENGDRHFMIGDAINPSINNEQGIPIYKYDKGKVIARTATEINTDVVIVPVVPTETEQLREDYDTLKAALIAKAVIKETDLTAVVGELQSAEK